MSSVQQISEERKALNRLLYILSRKHCTEPDNKEAVVWVREGACEAVTNITRIVNQTNDYSELTIAELKAAIRYLNEGATALADLKAIPDANKGKYLTKDQNGKLHFVMLLCAVHYAPVDVQILVGKRTLTGEALRRELQRAFDTGELQGALLKHCYAWANPKIHAFLQQSGLRYQHKMPTATYYVKWSEITREEANELIKRFQKIADEIVERYTPQRAAEPYFSNN